MTREQKWWGRLLLSPEPEEWPEAWHLRRVDLRDSQGAYPEDLTEEQRARLARLVASIEDPRIGPSRYGQRRRPDRLRLEIWAVGRWLHLGRSQLARRFGVTPAFAAEALRQGPRIAARAI